MTSEITPSGISPSPYKTYSLQAIHSARLSVLAGRHHQNTFEVAPSHRQLADRKGVQFNVETVPDPLPEHLNKKRIGRHEELDKIRQQIAAACVRDGFGKPKDGVKVEATSKHDPNLIYKGGNGFIVAVVTSFAQHLPLELAPDHIWALITYAFAKHVGEHPEELRDNFVSHKGKKRILITTSDSFQMSQDNSPDTGATPEEWEEQVFAQFSAEIRKHIGEKTHDVLVPNFSSTAPSSKAASEVVLMAAMKHYFSFGMETACGIPNIALVGTEQDWIALRQRVETLGNLMMPDFEQYWMPALLPVLDKFVDSYQGRVDHGFWQSMVKLRHNGAGSGYREFISGWIQIFFPHLGYSRRSKAKQTMRQWNEFYFSGPKPDEFPSVESFAPCDWNYHGSLFDLEFHAGIAGVSQDPDSGRLAPVTGWYVVHTPPKGKARRMEDIFKEIQDLERGHKEDMKLGYEHYKDQPWNARVRALWKEMSALEMAMMGVDE
ncbi:expressed unknown protein [Seminavis robusta]|uniref:Uncharacterized protein n=1 Tax=Seminavis robusta TaxID=568900 RepID=A0A9N8HKL4_9STRA|nr:expressed unknown protein [Seminavis robusta]|eukprot:Sro741_g195740.1 n/a (491) ;mRNA; f:29193-30665